MNHQRSNALFPSAIGRGLACVAGLVSLLLLRPLPVLGQPAVVPQAPVGPELEFTAFHDKTFIAATRSGSPVLLYFEADWCGPCKELHARTFRDPAVMEAAKGFHRFRVDMTKRDSYVDLVKKSFRVVGAPTVVLFGPDGKERRHRFGFIPPEEFAQMLLDSQKPSADALGEQ